MTIDKRYFKSIILFTICCLFFLTVMGCGKDSSNLPLEKPPISTPTPRPSPSPFGILNSNTQEDIWTLKEQGKPTQAEQLRKTLLKAMTSGNLKEIKHPLNHQDRQVFLLEDRIKLLFKPDYQIKATHLELFTRLANDGAYDNANSEVAVYILSEEILEINTVPAAVLFNYKGIRGSLHFLIENAEKKLGTPSENILIRLLDLIAGNDDRHPGNYLLLKKRRIAIDNGLAFRGLEGGCHFGNELYIGYRIECNPYPRTVEQALLGLPGNIQGRPEYQILARDIPQAFIQKLRAISDSHVQSKLRDYVEPARLGESIQRIHDLDRFLLSHGY